MLLILGALLMPAATAEAQPNTDWKLVVHGGAGTIERSKMTPQKDSAIRAALNRALETGSRILSSGGAALDAVEATVRVLEDDPNFNAGRGAVFTYDETHELDASIMDGRTRAAGAVAAVSATRNPIGLARAVMEKSPHVFLAGKGADRFSAEQGLPQVPNSYFSTPDRRRQLDAFKTKKVSALEIEYKYGTVGAVALDAKGHLAAATSTGGTTGKRWGRIGDSPVIGAGTYADDRACAVSATGTGEYFIRAGAAHEICARIRLKGEAPQVAADAVIKEIGGLGGDGGVIVLTPRGERVYSFNTKGMYRGMADKAGRSVAIYGDDDER
ncbi:isoaspartyl peptidase/L-asparaginase family protein [Sphingomonas sp.]|uniref:isoaspartyl peptidase/L-asparaginase family protein n=1 Tax=Sphingomonas sp. TaxID=28214 RepID=UPI0025CCE827|nr:isoaspartyl peptidase/L-asparaginase [Sphingomonas sp.]